MHTATATADGIRRAIRLLRTTGTNHHTKTRSYVAFESEDHRLICAVLEEALAHTEGRNMDFIRPLGVR